MHLPFLRAVFVERVMCSDNCERLTLEIAVDEFDQISTNYYSVSFRF